MEKDIQELTNYCLNCASKPCSQKGCPLDNDIPTFIKYTKEGEFEQAYQTLIQTTVLGSVCGRICPHQKQCQGSCVRGFKNEPVSIGEIEAFIFDKAFEEKYDRSIKKENVLANKKVAIVGGGPSGLTCSAFLARKGAKVTIYEKYDVLGGILSHGIPDFRLDKKILNKTITSILNLGIEVKYGKELGRNLQLADLQKQYDAVFLAFGANISRKMEIEGEELEGVFGGNALLELQNHPDYENKIVAVSGGGNVAMDCARTIKRLGAKKVMVIYRRSKEEMPAEEKEIMEAKEDGVEFLFQNNIVKILGNKKVEHIECVKTKLIEKEGAKRKIPIDIDGSNYILDVDYVVMAVGANVETDILNTQHLPSTERKYLEVGQNYRVGDTNIFAGGDLIGTTSTVAWAARDGREAARAIEEYIN